MAVETEQRRAQILDAALRLVEQEGIDALSTRAIATAAGVRAASIYQIFADKEALLDALARVAFEHYLAEKRALAPSDDPIDDLRRGWNAHVDFGLAHPAMYLLMYGVDRPRRAPPAQSQARDQLRGFLDRCAAQGCLRVAPALAVEILQAAASGVTMQLISTGELDRDHHVSRHLREAVIGVVTTGAPKPPSSVLTTHALGFDAALQSAERRGEVGLRPTEVALMRDWLHRL